ncbi:SAV_915 family protein [Streptomyces sp. NPDC007861]|uniref:SAV_915 family protein n=1 Tax=Streptomyces sp. NPDC007861 TaxID=3154893 RepID=UPI0033C87A24
MSSVDHSEDPEPSERIPAGPLFVPVRPGRTGCTARFFRTPLGRRTAVGFTSAERLAATLGEDQPRIRLSEPALRALAAPLGVTALTIDPQLSAPAPAAGPALAAAPAPAPVLTTGPDRERARRDGDPQHAGVLPVTGAAAVVSCPNLLLG